MRRVSGFLLVALMLVASSAGASVLLLANSGESVTLECRDNSLYFGYQIDGLKACSEYACMTIYVRVDGTEWTKYSAHNGSNMGFVRNRNDSFRRNGGVAETLLKEIVGASSVEFQSPQTEKTAEFSISDADRKKLLRLVTDCAE